ncbi:hypothetical protein ACH3XW_11240 [Acanthocheilonema viteae]
MHDQKQIDKLPLIQSSPSKWMRSNEVQYSYGWWGIKCQSTTNLVLTEREIFLNDGMGFISNLEHQGHGSVKVGKCITNTSIVLWNSTDAFKQCPYRKVGRYEAIRHGDHFSIDDLQASFVIDKKK